jgi:hypothetical protein
MTEPTLQDVFNLINLEEEETSFPRNEILANAIKSLWDSVPRDNRVRALKHMQDGFDYIRTIGKGKK